MKPYGVFVKVIGITALLHKSQVSKERVTDMKKLFRVGERVRVLVLEINKKKKRVRLSTKKLESTPGEMLQDRSLVYANAEQTLARLGVQPLILN